MRSKKTERELEALLRGLSGGRLSEPPAGTLRRAKALGAQLPGAAAGLVEWVASLVFDSGAEPALAGVRSGEAGERRLLYRNEQGDEPCEIDLRLRRAGATSIELMGQILPVPTGGRATLVAGERRREARLGEDGDFVIRRFGAGGTEPRLEIELEQGVRIILEALPLPEGS